MGSQWDLGEGRDALEQFFPPSPPQPHPKSLPQGAGKGNASARGAPAPSHVEKKRTHGSIFGVFFIKILLYQVECYSNLGIGRHNETAKFTFKYLR